MFINVLVMFINVLYLKVDVYKRPVDGDDGHGLWTVRARDRAVSCFFNLRENRDACVVRRAKRWVIFFKLPP